MPGHGQWYASGCLVDEFVGDSGELEHSHDVVLRCTGLNWHASSGPAREGSAVVASATVFFLLGGQDGAVQFNDVWRSWDGRNWLLVNTDAAWGARSAHAAVRVPTTGHIVLMGGRVGASATNDVWLSVDSCASFTAAAATAPWGARFHLSAVALPSGAVVVLGGTNAGAVYGDVWRSRDEGTTWVRGCYVCRWVPRYGAGAVVTEDGRLVLAGGHAFGSLAVLNDVWVSSDEGDTWSRRTAAAPWAARVGLSAVAFVGATVAVVGGATADLSEPHTLMNDVWLSTDAGATWLLVDDDAVWTPRAFHTATVWTGGSALVLLGGSNGTGTALDAWQGWQKWGGGAFACDTQLPAMCGARPRSTAVTVSIPAASGNIEPPNAASQPLNIVYAPPAPSLEVAQLDPTSGSWLVVASFSSRVTGVSTTDFTFTSDQGAAVSLYSAGLHGSGAVWELTVVIGVTTTLCPPGFTASQRGLALFCARVNDSPDTWVNHNTACGPYALATVLSSAESRLATTSAPALLTPYWCVRHRNPSPPVWLCLTRCGPNVRDQDRSAWCDSVCKLHAVGCWPPYKRGRHMRRGWSRYEVCVATLARRIASVVLYGF